MGICATTPLEMWKREGGGGISWKLFLLTTIITEQTTLEMNISMERQLLQRCRERGERRIKGRNGEERKQLTNEKDWDDGEEEAEE